MNKAKPENAMQTKEDVWQEAMNSIDPNLGVLRTVPVV